MAPITKIQKSVKRSENQVVIRVEQIVGPEKRRKKFQYVMTVLINMLGTIFSTLHILVYWRNSIPLGLCPGSPYGLLLWSSVYSLPPASALTV